MRITLPVALAAATLFISAPSAQSGRPLTIHDLLVAIHVEEPQPSPAGRSVVYVRTTTDQS
jgi:hypothetical protein